jgi:hypothetical protein
MLWFVVIVLGFAALWFCLGGTRRPERDQVSDWHSPHLDAIHRRFQLARFKYEVRRDAAAMRRGLREDLRRLHERERW